MLDGIPSSYLPSKLPELRYCSGSVALSRAIKIRNELVSVCLGTTNSLISYGRVAKASLAIQKQDGTTTWGIRHFSLIFLVPQPGSFTLMCFKFAKSLIVNS